MRPTVHSPQPVRPLKRSLDSIDPASDRPSASKHPRLASLPLPLPSPDPSDEKNVSLHARGPSNCPSKAPSQPTHKRKMPSKTLWAALRQRGSVYCSRRLLPSRLQYTSGFRRSLAYKAFLQVFSAPRLMAPPSSSLGVLSRHQRESKCRNRIDSGLRRPRLVKIRDRAHLTHYIDRSFTVTT